MTTRSTWERPRRKREERGTGNANGAGARVKVKGKERWERNGEGNGGTGGGHGRTRQRRQPTAYEHNRQPSKSVQAGTPNGHREPHSRQDRMDGGKGKER